MSLAPDNAADVLKDLGRGLKLIKAKQPEYVKREEYYQGERREVITHPKLEKLLNRYGEAFRLNYAAVPCDALMDRLELMSLTTGDATVDNLLKARLWDPNSLDDDSDDIHLHACYLGDYYVIAEPIETDEQQNDDEDETGTGVGTIELTPKHPTTTIVVYQRSNSRIPDFAVQMIDKAGDGEWDALVYYDDETWAFTAEKAGDGFDVTKYDLDLDVDDDGQPDPIANEVGLFPVFHFRPDQKPYGKPINSKMYGPQDAITKINATQMASMDYYGFPQRFATMDPNAEEGDDIDDDFNDDGTELSDEAGGVAPQGESKLSSDPGGMWLLRGVRSAGSFQPADPKGFLDPLTFQIRAGATLSRTPLYEFDLEGGGQQPSGEARRRADGPITKHAGKIKSQFGTVWTQIGDYTLAALKQTSGKKVEAVWAPSETATDSEGLDLVAKKIENGIPPRQALLEAGYTQKQVDDFLPIDEDNGLAMPLTPNIVVKLSTALQNLGQAKNLGSVTDDQIRRVFRVYWGDTAGDEQLTTGAGGYNPFTRQVSETQQTSPTDDIADKADALGKLVRAGVRQEDAARILGINGVTFDGVPVALRDDTPGAG